jgi:hypothetical protein
MVKAFIKCGVALNQSPEFSGFPTLMCYQEVYIELYEKEASFNRLSLLTV